MIWLATSRSTSAIAVGRFPDAAPPADPAHRPALGRPPRLGRWHPQRFPFAEDNLRGIERHIRPVQVVVIRHAGAARAQFHQPMRTRRKVCSSKAARKRYGVALSQAVRPGSALRLALQQRLKKMVVRVHPRRIDHAVAGIDLLFRQRRQAADGGNLAVADEYRPGQPRRLSGQTARMAWAFLIINDMASLLRFNLHGLNKFGGVGLFPVGEAAASRPALTAKSRACQRASVIVPSPGWRHPRRRSGDAHGFKSRPRRADRRSFSGCPA